MAKKTYATPVADMLRFDYKEIVTAASDGKSNDASHCTFSRQPGGCAPKTYGTCREYYTSSPGGCDNNG